MATPVDLSSARNLTGFDAEIKKVLLAAHALGWQFTKTAKGGYNMLAPDGARLYAPRSKPGQGVAKDLQRAIVKHTPRQVAEDYADRAAASLLAGDPTKAQEALHLTEFLDVTEGGVGALGLHHDVLQGTPDPPTVLEPTIVSERPFVAKNGNALSYESGAINERTWSDGSKDYECTWPNCHFIAPTVRKVGGHRRAHRSVTPPGPRIPGHITDDDRVKRLAREISEAINTITRSGVSVENVDLGQALAEQIIAKRRERGEVHDTEPLTPEQTIDRIRALIAGDLLTGQQALESRVAELSASLAEVQTALQVSRDHERSLRETLGTLGSLAVEATREEGG